MRAIGARCRLSDQPEDLTDGGTAPADGRSARGAPPCTEPTKKAVFAHGMDHASRQNARTLFCGCAVQRQCSSAMRQFTKAAQVLGRQLRMELV
jgi:hypothetical protein